MAAQIGGSGERIIAEQCRPVLRIKDNWHLLPAYLHQLGGLEIYTAVLDDGVRTPASSRPDLPSTGCR